MSFSCSNTTVSTQTEDIYFFLLSIRNGHFGIDIIHRLLSDEDYQSIDSSYSLRVSESISNWSDADNYLGSDSSMLEEFSERSF